MRIYPTGGIRHPGGRGWKSLTTVYRTMYDTSSIRGSANRDYRLRHFCLLGFSFFSSKLRNVLHPGGGCPYRPPRVETKTPPYPG